MCCTRLVVPSVHAACQYDVLYHRLRASSEGKRQKLQTQDRIKCVPSSVISAIIVIINVGCVDR
eukprot:342077-Rhodomonas_salina.1